MDASDPAATTPEEYLGGTADFRTDLYAHDAQLLTHADSIELFRDLGAKFAPELKEPSVKMPFRGFTREDYAQKMIDEYVAAGVPASDVWPQSFHLADVLYWIENMPAFGAQAVYLIDPDARRGFDNMDPESWGIDLADLKGRGLNYIAPPLFVLVTLDGDEMVPSAFAISATEAGLKIVAWTLERSGPLHDGGGWYYQSVSDVIDTDGDAFEMLDVLAKDVGVVGVFSDWPATVTYYANCKGL